MKNYLFKIKYLGCAFHGWQRQENAPTVQQAVEEALEAIFSQKVTAYGCSRTDAGVHAEEFFFNCRLETEMPCERMVTALNAVLPFEVAVIDCKEVDDSFHARFNCVKKQYVYRVLTDKVRNPFILDKAYHYKYGLDEELLNAEAKAFIGTYNYSSFCSAGSSVEDTVRTVYSFDVTKKGNITEFTVCGNGFLYNMVRIMVGTLIDIGRGKIERGSIPDIIKSGDRGRAGVTAPACGLYLNKVYYEDENND